LSLAPEPTSSGIKTDPQTNGCAVGVVRTEGCTQRLTSESRATQTDAEICTRRIGTHKIALWKRRPGRIDSIPRTSGSVGQGGSTKSPPWPHTLTYTRAIGAVVAKRSARGGASIAAASQTQTHGHTQRTDGIRAIDNVIHRIRHIQRHIERLHESNVGCHVPTRRVPHSGAIRQNGIVENYFWRNRHLGINNGHASECIGVRRGTIRNVRRQVEILAPVHRNEHAFIRHGNDILVVTENNQTNMHSNSSCLTLSHTNT
jgi:hypothetical protein